MHSSKSYIHPTLIYPPQAFFQPAATVRLHLGVLVQHSPLSSAQIGKNHYASNNRRTAAEVTSTATRIKIKLPLNLRFLPKCVVDVWHISTPHPAKPPHFSATPSTARPKIDTWGPVRRPTASTQPQPQKCPPAVELRPFALFAVKMPKRYVKQGKNRHSNATK